ncbi:MAG: hypothetical protein ACH0QD_05370 [Tepidibacillus sp.]
MEQLPLFEDKVPFHEVLRFQEEKETLTHEEVAEIFYEQAQEWISEGATYTQITALRTNYQIAYKNTILIWKTWERIGIEAGIKGWRNGFFKESHKMDLIDNKEVEKVMVEQLIPLNTYHEVESYLKHTYFVDEFFKDRGLYKQLYASAYQIQGIVETNLPDEIKDILRYMGGKTATIENINSDPLANIINPYQTRQLSLFEN